MMMLIEIHHLEAIELVGYSLDLLLLTRLLHLDSFRIPTFRQRVSVNARTLPTNNHKPAQEDTRCVKIRAMADVQIEHTIEYILQEQASLPHWL